MALINKLRDKMGRVVVVAVGLAIMSFVLADLLGPNSVIFGGQSYDMAEISGETIQLQDYQRQIDELSYNFSLNQGRNPSAAELNSIRQQAWELLIINTAFQKEYESIGLQVTEEEVVDMVQGKNISSDIVRAFTNPNTGVFDKEFVVGYLQRLPELSPQEQAAWYSFEGSLAPARLRLKYDNLLLGSNYVTEEEARTEYESQNSSANIKYLYVPYYSVNDSLVEATDDELKAYLEEHKKEYQVEQSRTLKYVMFPILPSAEDSAYFFEEMEQLRSEFASTKDDSLFAKAHSDGLLPFTQYTAGNIPPSILDKIPDLAPGTIAGPFQEGRFLRLYKVSAKVEDTLQSARANHILIQPEGDSDQEKTAARDKARDILNQIRGGSDFGGMASIHGTDGTKSRGGDLGWFTEGRMVGPFNDAVFNATRLGLLPSVVETEFGYHVVEITELPTKDAFKIATIEREITPSDDTRDQVFRQSDYFAGTSTTVSEFTQNAEKDSLLILVANRIEKNDTRINNLNEARSVVRWLFNDASVGDVSTVFELSDQYLVATMVSEIEEGTAPLTDVRLEISTKLKNQKKGDIIFEKLSELSGSLEEIAEQYGEGANVYATIDLKLNSNSLPNVGISPIGVGKAFSLEQGQPSKPCKDENGVLILELVSITGSPEIADYTIYSGQVQQRRDNTTSFDLSEAIKEDADILDNRYKFY